MLELKAAGMQRLSSEPPYCVAHGSGRASRTPRTAAINGIPDYRVPQMSQMHPNLVRASGLKLNIKKSQTTEFSTHSIMRYGLSAARAYTHALALTRVPSDRLLNGSACDQIALDQGLIPSSDFTCLKLSGQCRAGFRIMCYCHKSGRVPVQSMHNPRSRHFGSGWKAVQESVLDCPVRMPGSRVHDLSGRLVQDNQVFISINNSQGQVLWFAL